MFLCHCSGVNSNKAHDSTPPPPSGYAMFPAPGGGGQLVMVKRKRGRPRKIQLAPLPSIAQSEYNERVLDARATYINADPLVQAGINGADSREILTIASQGLAEELASLAHIERDFARRGRDVGQVSSRRVDALKKLALIQETLVVQHDRVVDLKCEVVQRALRYWVETVMKVLGDELRPHQLDLVVNRLQAEMGEFEARLADVLR